MSDYNSNRKDIGATGSQWPDNYYHIEGEAPVAPWENNFKHNVNRDIDHLIDLTNKRLESSSGAAGGEPSSPEDGEQYWDTDNQELKIYDESYGGWKNIALGDDVESHATNTNNPHSVTLEQVSEAGLTLNGQEGSQDDVPTINADGNLVWGEGGIGAHDHSDDAENGGSVIRPSFSSMKKTLPSDESLTVGGDESVVVGDEYTVEGELTIEDGGSFKVV